MNDAAQAESFSAFLTVQGISNKVELDDGKYDLWVKEEDRLDQAAMLLKEFETDPNHQRYVNSVNKAQKLMQDEVERRKKVQKKIVNVRERWPRGQQRKAPLTITLMVLAGIVTVLAGFRIVPPKKPVPPTIKAMSFVAVEGEAAEKVHAANDNPDELGVRMASVFRGEVWRLITPIFLHSGVIHLFFNLFMLFQLGRVVEDRYGTLFFSGLVLLAAVVPNFLQGVMPEALDGSAPIYERDLILGTFGGMSGVVYAIFGFIWIKSLIDPSFGFQIPPFFVFIMIGWFFMGVFHLFDNAGISMANWGHGGGLVVGIAIAYLSTVIGKQ
jgi:GlpG protein